MNIDYSVIIRTTGNAKEKYQALLDSIQKLDPKPIEVIVVLPEGYPLPKEQLGWETFYFSKKGMVVQRMYGIEKCTTKYALICDDDMAFSPDFVQKLYQPIQEGLCKITAGPLYSLLPQPGITSALCTITSGAVKTAFHKDRYITILRTSGYSYNRNLDPAKQTLYASQSLSWGCFFAEIASIHDICFQDEIWVDARGYAALDDQTMFYKGWLRGICAYVVPEAVYEHLDAGTSSKNNKTNVPFSMACNRVIFWKRFILDLQKNIFAKMWTCLCFAYYLLINAVFDTLMLCKKRDTQAFLAKYRGLRHGWQYIRSTSYQELPPVR